ncbi:arginine-glutamic acid dipeptide repeats protein [Ischnura elegans]|uniref:arginine-glutamic acid dipeptide repeats protein n=1 Tax=Ischnura elegans TaxID=197161 RepID=UPI001ED89327|nr:arginine-glutamic acid dipeptide repeats protein [Ischnura elegans]
MKSRTLALLLLATVALAQASSLPAAADTQAEDAEQEAEDQRDKRALSFLAEKITSKFASKLGWVGPPDHPPHPPPPPPPQHELEYGPPITYHTKNFDIWAFKKAILNALFQAVKAIKGGIIAVKGQILKAKGHLLQTKGSILAAKGDAITNFGRQVAAKSLLDHSILYDGPVHSPIGFSAPSGYGAAASTTAVKEAAPPPLPTKASDPEPAEPSYGPPILPTLDSYRQFKEEAAKDYGQEGLPNGVQAGLLVLRPINVPSSGGGGSAGLSGHFAEPPGSYESPQQVSPSYEYNIQGSAGNYGESAGNYAGNSPGNYGGFAGPLSPAAYEGFGGHSDLSASFSQSALQSNQNKRANPLPQRPQPQRAPVYHSAPRSPPHSPQYHQLPLPGESIRSGPPRVLPQRSVPPRAGPPPLTIVAGPSPPRGFYIPRTAFGQRL